MQRLIKDANKIRKQQGINTKLSINNYSDIIEAIHTVQSEMGITGTTANEAASTIQGSLAMTKSAWQNLIAGLGNSEADMNQLVNDFVTSAETAIGNLVPVVTKVLGNMGTVISQLAPVIGAALPGLFQAIIPDLVSASIALISTFGAALPSLLMTLVDSLSTSISMLFSSIAANMGENNPASAIFTMLANAVAGIPGAIQFVIDKFNEFVTWITSNEAIMNTLNDIFEALKTVVYALWEGLKLAVDKIGEFIQWLHDGSPEAEIFKDACIIVAGALAGLKIAHDIARGIEALKTALNTLQLVFDAFDLMKAGSQFGLIGLAIGALVAAFVVLWAKCEAFREFWINLWNTISSATVAACEAVKLWCIGAWDSIASTSATVWEGIKTTVTGAWDSISSAASTTWEAIKTAIETPINAAKNAVSDAIEAIKGFFNFDFKWPHLPMPHFSFSGSWNPFDWPDLFPSIGVSWYSKAMNNAMLLTKPTIFGADDSGKFLAGGEAGPELVAGANTVQRMIYNAVHAAMGVNGNGITINQNIYSEAKTAADLMQEARYNAETAVLMGV